MKIIELLRDIGIFGLVMWFIQMLLSKSANRQFESYKNELTNTTIEHQALLDSKLELYKTELNLQNYKTTKIYEQQLSIIIELHKKLLSLNQEMAIMAIYIMKNVAEPSSKTQENESSQVAKTILLYDSFVKYYQENVLFIPQNTADKIEKISKKYSTDLLNYVTKTETSKDFAFNQAKEVSERLTNDIKEAIDQLKVDFRKLLGVEMK
ncbi:MAG: hypothetical protein JNK09_13715 [Prolixibacteraceae bacterium]|nr:hypothetical protein [Prolixibacteraceae bacterium]